jgi:hypothetical protein
MVLEKDRDEELEPIVCKVKKYYKESRRTGISYIQ